MGLTSVTEVGLARRTPADARRLAAAVLALVALLVGVAVPAQAALPKVSITGFDSTTRTMAVNTTWRDAVQVGTSKGRKVLVQRAPTSTGAWTTVSTLFTGRNGSLTISIKPTRVGTTYWRLFTPKTTRTAATASRVKKVIAKQPFPTRIQGPISGAYEITGSFRLNWSGTVQLAYQQNDPVLNQPWNDGQIHYVLIDGSFTWSVQDGPNECTYSGAGTVAFGEAHQDGGEMTITKARTSQGWEWNVGLGLRPQGGTLMAGTKQCPSQTTPVEFGNYVGLLGEGAVVYNGVPNATGSNQVTSTLSSFSGTTTVSFPGFVEQLWVQNLTGSAFELL
jgi:hypothetical protein